MHSACSPPYRKYSPIAAAEYGARYFSGADCEAVAATTVVYSMAPAARRRATTVATVDAFWPMAT